MADNALQEVEIPFNGRVFRVRPEYLILARIEAVTGTPLRELAKRAIIGLYGPFDPRRPAGNELGLGEIALILGIILEGQKDAPKPEEIGPVLVQDGYADLMTQMTKLSWAGRARQQGLRARAARSGSQGRTGGHRAVGIGPSPQGGFIDYKRWLEFACGVLRWPPKPSGNPPCWN